MSNWMYIVILVVVVYLAISIVLYYVQEYFIFKPEKLDQDFQFHYENQKVKEYNLKTRDGATINGLHFLSLIHI